MHQRCAAPDDHHVPTPVDGGQVVDPPALRLIESGPNVVRHVSVRMDAVEFSGGASPLECLAFILGGPPQSLHASLDAVRVASVPFSFRQGPSGGESPLRPPGRGPAAGWMRAGRTSRSPPQLYDGLRAIPGVHH